MLRGAFASSRFLDGQGSLLICRVHGTASTSLRSTQPFRTLTSNSKRCHGSAKRSGERSHVRCSSAVAEAVKAVPKIEGSQVRVRFAPSPTGNLHVGGARTALFNWLLAKNTGGKMVLRIEDTDAARSTRESEQAVLHDLSWLGIHWDEGPDIGGEHGPYRQSERKEIYMKYVNQLVEQGVAYPCFCTDAELEKMREDAELKKLPPIYRGKWGSASPEEVEAAKAEGLPFCYRFRVPKNKDITIRDMIRGKVTWNSDTLGDFVIMRSNGLPVYNFCVAVDDALMKITHVVRAEEHLPNTLRQVLIYNALGFKAPVFGHVSLILAPDKTKLSKRHGATSVGEFKEQGFLPEAMVNYLSLLGWNDGTEQEIFTREELSEKFTLDRVTKSAAVFDKTKLSWMNGQHLRSMEMEELAPLVASAWVQSGLIAEKDPLSPFVAAAAALVKGNLELVVDADRELRAVLGYPLEATLASAKVQAVIEDKFEEIAAEVVQAVESGELEAALAASGAEGYKAWVKGVGKRLGRKGKRLFMPLRVALTGRMEGPEVGDILALLRLEDGDVAEEGVLVPLPQRMQTLQALVLKS